MEGSGKDQHKGFRISARTILQLGGELISSDGIAFYELIKNAFDAGSEEVRIHITVRLPHDLIEETLEQLSVAEKADPDDIEERVKEITNALAEQVPPAAPDADEFIARLQKATTVDAVKCALDDANEIRFEDTGHGMSLDDLSEVYLRVGTPARLIERRREVGRVILGEKGIGRLSVMRLGSKLLVKTSRSNEPRWNLLRIDWRDFERDLDQLVGDVPVAPEKGPKKEHPENSGTVIGINALRTNWTEDKLRHIAMTDLSRTTDPFSETDTLTIRLRFNDSPVRIERMSELLFQHAHAVVSAELKFIRGKAVLTGLTDYRYRKREQEFRLEKNDLYNAAGEVKPYVINRLGPFSVRFYWFNRGLLDPIEGIGTVTQVKRLIAQWSGGLMVYRDGFRVAPYGGPDDDWLDLDRAAFGAGGYKVNRAQLIGKVDITSRGNPQLIDQTSREGLSDCPEKAALVALLRTVLLKQFKVFIDHVDEEVSLLNAPTGEELEQRFESQEEELRRNLQRLRRIAADHPEVELAPLVARLAKQASQIRRIIRGATEVQQSAERRRGQLLDLAGIGLMAEILAHELNRSVIHALKGLSTALSASPEKRLTSLLRSAEAQLKSLQKRVTVLDSLSTTGRQRPHKFEAVEIVHEVFEGRAEQFERHEIKASVQVSPHDGVLNLRMVKGMFHQIIENMVENSVYWLKSEKRLNSGFKPSISVRIDVASTALFFTDNGPGIDPMNAEQVFMPFFSLKKRGKGLGLYVCQEYARDQGLEMSLSRKSDRTDGRLNTFVLNLAGVLKE